MKSSDIYFKLKDKFLLGFDCIILARNIIGELCEPSDFFYTDMGSTGWEVCTAKWRFADAYQQIDLTLTKHYSKELWIEWNFELLGTEISNNQENIFKKFKVYKDVVSKPWSDWSEQEILENPMWIYIYQEENRATDQMHNAMVLFSYENPTNHWVKRYFHERSKGCSKANEE